MGTFFLRSVGTPPAGDLPCGRRFCPNGGTSSRAHNQARCASGEGAPLECGCRPAGERHGSRPLTTVQSITGSWAGVTGARFDRKWHLERDGPHAHGVTTLAVESGLRQGRTIETPWRVLIPAASDPAALRAPRGYRTPSGRALRSTRPLRGRPGVQRLRRLDRALLAPVGALEQRVLLTGGDGGLGVTNTTKNAPSRVNVAGHRKSV